MHQWRRSYDIAPPNGESLKDTAARVLPYYITDILPRVMRGERVLCAAHGNSLRALVMVLDRHTNKTILDVNLGTGGWGGGWGRRWGGRLVADRWGS